MEDLTDLVKQFTIKNDRTIKKICTPLLDCFGIHCFSYYFINPDGHFGTICSLPEQLLFYYEQELYLTNPWLRHPKLLRSGYAYIPATPDKILLEVSDKKYQVRNMLLILQHQGENLEGFTFVLPTLNPNNCADFFLKNLDLFYKFISYFKLEAKLIIENLKQSDYNLKEAKGELFFEDSTTWPLSKQDPNASHFLKKIDPLSLRESQCLNLFKKGKSAQATAASLGLSQRTVEHYFENIKNKLGCLSKWDLLEF